MKRSLNKIVREKYNGDFNKAIRDVHTIEKDLKISMAQKLLKENGNKIPYHRWYKGEQFNYEGYAKAKGKIVGYFKSYSVGRGGARKGWIYYTTYETGVIVYVDTEMGKIGIRQGLSYPGNFQPANKKEFDTAYKNFIKMIN